MSINMHIDTSDGVRLLARLYKPDQGPKAAVFIGPGLGIPKEYYSDYCEFLQANEFLVLIIDYRGLADTKGSKNEPHINLRNWGLKDIPTALDWIHTNHPSLKIYYVGHSIAGQIAGLVHNHHLVKRFIFISSTGGHPSLFRFSMNLFSWFMFYVHLPLTPRLLGHLPPSLTYRGVSIAKHVAIEWAQWSRNKAYIKGFLGITIPQMYYDAITQHIDWITFTDDSIATEKAVQFMMDYYNHAEIKHHRFNPTAAKLPRVGHAGFFRKKLGSAYWKLSLDILNDK